MSKIIALLCVFSLTTGCSHYLYSNGKGVNLKASAVLGSSDSKEQLSLYKKGLFLVSEGKKAEACTIFEKLASSDKFPLQHSATLRSLELCSYSIPKLEEVWNKELEQNLYPKYLKDAFYKLALQTSKNLGEKEIRHKLLFAGMIFETNTNEKEKMLKEAILIATTLKDEESLKKYNERLIQMSPRLNPEVTKDNILEVARDFEKVRAYKEARDLYLKIIESKDISLDKKYKAYNYYRTTYKIERDLKTFNEKTYEMEEFFKKILERDPSNKEAESFLVDTQIAHARAVWTNHENEKARQILNSVIDSRLGSANQIAQTHWVLASIFLEEKDFVTALSLFERALLESPSDLNLLENIQWSIVWINYLQKNFEVSVSKGQEFAESSKNINFIQKLLFWDAKALEKLNRSNEARKIYAKVHKNDPYGYYGIVASGILKIPLAPIPPTKFNLDTTGDTTLDWLIASGELDFAKAYLKTIESKFKTLEERKFAMKLYTLTNWYDGAMRQLFNFPMEMRPEIIKDFSSAVFPTPHIETVKSNASKRSVPVSLIYSIIRQESAFDTNIRSWADAFGLMQLTPDAARGISKKHTLPYKDYNDLYNPDINLPLGIALVGDLRAKYKGSYIPVVGSYNASEEAVKTWLRDRFNGDYYEFIELVPYEETRNYFKLVYRNMMTYERILNTDSFIVDLDFFAKELK